MIRPGFDACLQVHAFSAEELARDLQRPRERDCACPFSEGIALAHWPFPNQLIAVAHGDSCPDAPNEVGAYYLAIESPPVEKHFRN